MTDGVKRRLSAAILALAALAPAAAWAQPGAASPPNARSSTNDCFYLHDAQGDVPYGDRAVLFRVNVSDFYRLDFADRCRELTLYPNPKLILTPENGNDLICHAIDLDVKVADQPGFGSIPISCIPTGLHRLTPAEVAAIPKKDLP